MGAGIRAVRTADISLGSYDILNPTFLQRGLYNLHGNLHYKRNGGNPKRDCRPELRGERQRTANPVDAERLRNDGADTHHGQTVYFSGNTAPLGQAATPFAVNVQIDRIDPVTGTAYAVLWQGCNFTSPTAPVISIALPRFHPLRRFSPGNGSIFRG